MVQKKCRFCFTILFKIFRKHRSCETTIFSSISNTMRKRILHGGASQFSQFITRVCAIRSGEQVFSVQNGRANVILSGGASGFRTKNANDNAFCTGEQVIFVTQNSCEGDSARGSKCFSLFIDRVIANLHGGARAFSVSHRGDRSS